LSVGDPLSSRSRLLRYSFAFLIVIAALLVRMALTPLTGVGAPWVVFFTAVVVATLYGGPGAGIFATLISALLGAAVFVVPAGHALSEAAVQSLLFAIDGFVLVYLGTLIVRARRRAEAAAAANALNEERLRLANEAAHIGSYDVDIRLARSVGTPELYQVLGIPPGIPLEKIPDHVHPDDRVMVEKAYTQALDPAGQGRIQLDHRIIRSNGEVGWVSWTGRTYFENGPRGRIAVRQLGVVLDITYRKRVEAELLDAAQKKDEFLAMLSHELRNPLAAIRSGITVIDRAPSGEAAQRARQVIDRQVTQLTRLVDDLLDVARITRGQMVLQRTTFELGELVRRIYDDQRALVQGRGVTFELHPSGEQLWLDGDVARVIQAVDNLIHNAAKFTPHGGRIELSLAREQGSAVLRVRDTGAGIPPEDLPRLFQPFVRLQATSGRVNGGLGLGLALVKGIVELHGGSVSVASKGVGLGSEFTIRLPLAPVPEAAIERPQLDSAHGRRVLVIEDNRDAAETLADVLQILGHDVRIAYNGVSGIAAASEFHPDVVLCDIGLPDMEGYEVARRLHSEKASSSALLVALSGYGQPEDRKRSADAGFARHIVKPVTIDTLQQAIA